MPAKQVYKVNETESLNLLFKETLKKAKEGSTLKQVISKNYDEIMKLIDLGYTHKMIVEAMNRKLKNGTQTTVNNFMKWLKEVKDEKARMNEGNVERENTENTENTETEEIIETHLEVMSKEITFIDKEIERNVSIADLVVRLNDEFNFSEVLTEEIFKSIYNEVKEQ